jgi:hypothetical protein
MVAQVARDYEGKVQFVTSPGLDSEKAMVQAVKDFGWPGSMTHAVDLNGDLWRHFQVPFRGSWIFLNNDGNVIYQSPSHIPEKDVRGSADQLLS